MFCNDAVLNDFIVSALRGLVSTIDFAVLIADYDCQLRAGSLYGGRRRDVVLYITLNRIGLPFLLSFVIRSAAVHIVLRKGRLLYFVPA